MSEEAHNDYTNLDFLSSLRNAPKKKKLFCQLSLNTDLEEINQMLTSPCQRKVVLPTSLDVEMTKTFVISLLRRYESEEEVQKKWDGFLQNVGSPQEFQKYVLSLKDVVLEQKEEPMKTNPEGDCSQKEVNNPKQQKKRSLTRIYSSKQIDKQKEHKINVGSDKLRNKLKNQIQQLKDLFMAGQHFIHSK